MRVVFRMTTETLARPGLVARSRAAAYAALIGAVAVVGPSLRATARVSAAQLADHFYTIAGLGCISAAGFVHSTFTGLLLTGLMFIVFEWKVSE